MDLKCPGSGESERNLWTNLDHLKARDEVKFVIADRTDYEWARDTIRERGLDRRVREGRIRGLLVSPVWGSTATDTNQGEGDPFLEALSGWILEDELPVRLQLQLHKLIWGPTARGV